MSEEHNFVLVTLIGSISSAAQTQACSPSLFVVMRQHGVKRSKARGRDVGRCRHQYAKYVDLLSTQEHKGSVFDPGVHPGFVVGKTLYLPARHSILHTEMYVICDAVCQVVDFLPMWAAECFLVCGVKVVSQSFTVPLRPILH